MHKCQRQFRFLLFCMVCFRCNYQQKRKSCYRVSNWIPLCSRYINRLSFPLCHTLLRQLRKFILKSTISTKKVPHPEIFLKCGTLFKTLLSLFFSVFSEMTLIFFLCDVPVNMFPSQSLRFLYARSLRLDHRAAQPFLFKHTHRLDGGSCRGADHVL